MKYPNMKPVVRNVSFIAVVIIISAWGLTALRGPNGLAALAVKRRQVQTLQEQNASLAADNERKRERIQLLKTSRPLQDLEIREKLKLLRPGETQFILPEATRDTAASKP